MLIDTHCHIHDDDYVLDSEAVIERAHQAGVMQMICVGTSEANSRLALEFANNHDGIYASVGIHPHEAKDGLGRLEDIIKLAVLPHKLVAVGEIGLDYHYNHSPRDVQARVLKAQIELALKYNLPIIFHVREAFDDFWKILDNYSGIRGVLHSFTDTNDNANEALKRGLYIGVNGFCTFTKDKTLMSMFAALPVDKLLVETDAPYLTPIPFRGKVNEPAFVSNIADFCGLSHQISVDEVKKITTTNAQLLFNLKTDN